MSQEHSDFDVVRKGEKTRTWYRNPRVFSTSQGWFISTREGVDVGPYNCQFDAEVDAETMVKRLSTCAPEKTRQVIFNQVRTASTGGTRLDSAAFTEYLVEEGGVELLRRAQTK